MILHFLFLSLPLCHSTSVLIVFLLFIFSFSSSYGFHLNFNIIIIIFLAWCLLGFLFYDGLSPIQPQVAVHTSKKPRLSAPVESSASSTISPAFLLRESNTGAAIISFCLSLSPPALTLEARDHVCITVEFSKELLVSNRVGMQCFFIQQMKYWMLILPDCINIVCIFKIIINSFIEIIQIP